MPVSRRLMNKLLLHCKDKHYILNMQVFLQLFFENLQFFLKWIGNLCDMGNFLSFGNCF